MVVVQVGLLVYVVATLVGFSLTLAPSATISLVVSNVPWTPINVTLLDEEVVVFTIPYAALLFCWVICAPALKLALPLKVRTISVTAVRICVEVTVVSASPGWFVDLWRPVLSKYTIPLVS